MTLTILAVFLSIKAFAYDPVAPAGLSCRSYLTSLFLPASEVLSQLGKPLPKVHPAELTRFWEEQVDFIRTRSKNGEKTLLRLDNDVVFELGRFLGEGGSAIVVEGRRSDSSDGSLHAIRIPKRRMLMFSSRLFVAAMEGLKEIKAPTVQIRKSQSFQDGIVAVELVDVKFSVGDLMERFSSPELAYKDPQFRPVIEELAQLIRLLSPYKFMQSDLHHGNIVNVRASEALGGRGGWIILDSADTPIPWKKAPEYGDVLDSVTQEFGPTPWSIWVNKIVSRTRSSQPSLD